MKQRTPFQLMLFLAIFLLSSCGYAVKNDLHQVYAKARYGEDKFISAGDHTIHYIEAGNGPTVLFISGLFGTYREWDRIIPSISRSYHILAIDHIGVGDSDKPTNNFQYTIEEQADLILKFMDELRLERAHIIGVSYGGMIALNMAARYPARVSSVACIEGAVVMPQHLPYSFLEYGLKFPLLGDIVISVIRSGLFDTAIAKSIMGSTWDGLSAEEKGEITGIVAHNTRTASREGWYSLTRALGTSRDFAEEAKSIRAPVLYLFGEDSSFREMTRANVDFFRAALPNMKIVSFQDGIHDLELQKPGEVSNLVLNFLGNSTSSNLALFPSAPPDGLLSAVPPSDDHKRN